MNYEQHRPVFEQRCHEHYLAERKRRNIPDDVDTPMAVEQLCWRHTDGRYGVHHINSAWAGFCWGLEQVAPVAPVLSEHEQRAILRDPVAIARIINHHDAEEAGADAIEPGWGTYHAKRVLELLALGRAVIAEDPEIWTESERAEFALRYSERAAQGPGGAS